MTTRRSFLRSMAAGGGAVFGVPRWLLAADTVGLVILHTNDTHSRMDPFPDGSGSFAGLGGVARRAALIERIRREHSNVLLLDSGDIFQGTPYFNYFGGEVEFKAMSAMGYDASTLGNHDFDNGIDGFTAMLPHATFDFVSANYDVAGSPLEPHVQPYVIRVFDRVKVGIFGLGVDFSGLVLPQHHDGVGYNDPVLTARRVSETLRNQGCHLVICLSHIGYRYPNDRVSDTDLANLVPEIDLILGGHTHTFMDQPDQYRQGESGFTLVNQVGWAGLRLGRIDVTFGPNAQALGWHSTQYEVSGGGKTRLS